MQLYDDLKEHLVTPTEFTIFFSLCAAPPVFPPTFRARLPLRHHQKTGPAPVKKAAPPVPQIIESSLG
jgi:hypothetical protein